MMIFLPFRDKLTQVPGVLGMSHRGAHLGELLDGVADLLIEDAAVGDHQDRIEHGGVVASRPISWWASQAIELLLPLPAECWIR